MNNNFVKLGQRPVNINAIASISSYLDYFNEKVKGVYVKMITGEELHIPIASISQEALDKLKEVTGYSPDTDT